MDKTKKNTKDNNNIFIEILLWAYKKQETGFSWQDLIKEFCLNDVQVAWVRKIFLTEHDADRKFFEILRNDESAIPNIYYYSLNEKGMSWVINYLGLKQAEKNNKRALLFAGFSLIVAAAGLFLTARGLSFMATQATLMIKQTNLMKIQSRSERIIQAQKREDSVERCKNDPGLKESGQFYVETGREVSCSELLKIVK